MTADFLKEVAAQVDGAEGSKKVREKAKANLVDRIVNERSWTLTRGVDKLELYNKDIAELSKHDQVHVNANGEEVGNYSKARWEELQKKKKHHAKLSEALGGALTDNPDYETLKKVLDNPDYDKDAPACCKK